MNFKNTEDSSKPELLKNFKVTATKKKQGPPVFTTSLTIYQTLKTVYTYFLDSKQIIEKICNQIEEQKNSNKFKNGQKKLFKRKPKYKDIRQN